MPLCYTLFIRCLSLKVQLVLPSPIAFFVVGRFAQGGSVNYKAVLFDYDGVLTTDKSGSLTTNTYISKITGIDYAAIDKAIRPYNERLLKGQLTHLDIWDDVCAKLNTKTDFKVLDAAFKSTPLNNDMLSLARKLKKQYKVGIITDNKKDRIDCLRVYQNLDEIFDPIIVSAEVGFNKLSEDIFMYAVNYLQLKPAECVFIDNTRENLEAPKMLGMATIYHDDKVNDVSLIEKILQIDLGITY